MAVEVSQKTMKALLQINMKGKAMGESKPLPRKENEEILNLKSVMDELYFLRHVTKDLQSFKEMIRLKKYD